MTCDYLKKHRPARANKEYLEILHLAAKESETGVDKALRWLFEKEQPISLQAIKKLMESNSEPTPYQEVNIEEVDLYQYDQLLKDGSELTYG